MESKKIKINWMTPAGIVSFLSGLICVIVGALQDNDVKGNITHIGGESASITVVSTVNWEQIVYIIVGFLFCVIGVCLIVFYLCCKNDFIKIEDNKVVCRGNLKEYTFTINDIEYCKASNFYLKLKRKNEISPIMIILIANAYDIALFIEQNKKQTN